MNFRRVFLLLTCCWELFRLFFSTSIFLSVQNSGRDPIVIILFLIINAGNIAVPLYVLYEEYTHKNTAGVFFYRLVKGWTVIWEGLLALLVSSFGSILLNVIEFTTGAQFLYRIMAGGLLSRLPGSAVLLLFFVDLIFLSGILLLKPGSPVRIGAAGVDEGSAPGSLPRADIVRIEEDT